MRSQTRFWSVVFAVLVTGWLCGCNSYVDYSGPSTKLDHRDLLADQYSSREQADKMQARLTESLQAWQAQRGDQVDAYSVGPGDHLRVSVFLPSKETPGTSVEVVVREDGMVALPLVGSVRVAGLELAEIEDKLERMYAQGYYRDPKVSAAVSQYNHKTVLVTGSVHQPGRITLKRNEVTLMEALALAGGLSETAGRKVQLTRASRGEGTEQLTVDLEMLVDDPMLQDDLAVGPGDFVHVQYGKSKDEEMFYVSGFVSSPGAYQFPEGQKLTVMEAIAFAKGLSPAARAENTYLLRQTEDGPRTYHVNLKEVAAADLPDIEVRPDDHIIVGTTWSRRTVDGVLRTMGLRSLAPGGSF